jgi:hypothetical protein
VPLPICANFCINRTLALYRGKFVDGFNVRDPRKPRVVHQSAVKFAGANLRRLTSAIKKQIKVTQGFGPGDVEEEGDEGNDMARDEEEDMIGDI